MMNKLFILIVFACFTIVYGQDCDSNESCVFREDCFNKTEVVNPAKGAPRSENRAVLEQIYCEQAKICCPNASVRFLSDKHTEEPIQLLECGMRRPRAPTFDVRIITTEYHKKNEDDLKETTEYGEFPWMILILKKIEKTENDFERLCGGSLISPHIVLTSAHSLKRGGPENFKARAGEWNLDETDLNPEGSVERQVVRIAKHKEFSKGTLHNDIAIMWLKTAFELSDSINVICLPPQGQQFDGKRCFASGWGKNSYGSSGSYQSILQKVEVPIVTPENCQNQLRETGRVKEEFQIHSSFICAGGEENRDSCTGDGGSALVCPIDGVENQFYQAGIVSWGIGCGTANVPGVYTNVPKFIEWINNEIN